MDHPVRDNGLVGRACAYPYDPGLESFAVIDGAPAEVRWDAGGPLGWPPTTPTLAIGSNGSLERIVGKFSGRPGRIAVAPAIVEDAAAVFAAHLTSYGAAPATLRRAPGARALGAIAWLDDAALARMHETEGLGSRYAFGPLEGVRARALIAGEPVFEAPLGYRAIAGVLRGPFGGPVRIAELASIGAPWPRASQSALLAWLARRFEPDARLDRFVAAVIEDARYRLRISAALGRSALADGLPGEARAGADQAAATKSGAPP